jgi:hypothetical protein
MRQLRYIYGTSYLQEGAAQESAFVHRKPEESLSYVPATMARDEHIGWQTSGRPTKGQRTYI